MLPNEVRLVFALIRKSRPDARIEAYGSAEFMKLLVAGEGLGMPPRSAKPPTTFGVCYAAAGSSFCFSGGASVASFVSSSDSYSSSI